MKEIQLTQELVALVDDEDFKWLSQWKWHAGLTHRATRFCAVRIGTKEDGDNWKKTLPMHRELLKCSKEQQCDHIDRNPLNNQKYNLRLCTGQQNSCNRANWSQYPFKGLHKATRQTSWTARIRVDGKLIGLGSYQTQEEAAQRYDAAAVYLFGEFANLNFPEHKDDYLKQVKELS